MTNEELKEKIEFLEQELELAEQEILELKDDCSDLQHKLDEYEYLKTHARLSTKGIPNFDIRNIVIEVVIYNAQPGNKNLYWRSEIPEAMKDMNPDIIPNFCEELLHQSAREVRKSLESVKV